jgi:hypothetical protein
MRPYTRAGSKTDDRAGRETRIKKGRDAHWTQDTLSATIRKREELACGKISDKMNE